MLLSLGMASCTDGNDWDVDNSLSRLFGVNADKISVETTISTAKVTFIPVPETEHYIMEVATDSLYDDIEMGTAANSIVFGEDGSITKSPATLENLMGDTKYYLRIKARSSQKTESRWVYYDGGNSFKTKAEQIFNEVLESDRFEDNIRLTWTPGAEVTHLDVILEGAVINSITLTDEAKANGEYTVTGLNPSTTYTFIIYNGANKRGELSVNTTAAMPAANYKYVLGAGVTQLTQDIIDEVALKAQEASGSTTNYSATIGIPAAQVVTFAGVSDSGEPTNIKIPDGMSVTFFGMAGGDKPTLLMKKNLDISGSHAYIRFENLVMTDNGAAYLVNQSNASTVGEFEVKDCDVSGCKNSFFRFQGSAVKTTENLILNNSTFTNIGSGYAFIHIDMDGKDGVVKNMNISNCTFNGICPKGKNFIYCELINMKSINIDHCTFYNVIGNRNYFIDFKDKSHGPEEFSITNSVFAKSGDEATDKNIRASIQPLVSEVYRTNDFFKNFDGIMDFSGSSADLFVDPDNGNFSFKPATINKPVGDPRWYTAE